jgi:hypothetical protein
MKKTILLAALMAVAAQWIHAQSSAAQPQIHVKGVVHQGVVRLRWIPADYGVFQKGNTYGYAVTRQLVSRNGATVSNEDRIASTIVLGPFSPLTETQWDAVADTSDIAGVAQAAIYAEEFNAAPIGGDQLYEAVNKGAQNENRYGFGLFAADQSFNIARYMGLALLDSTAVQEPNGDFTYRVVVLSPDTLTRFRGTGFVSVSQAFSTTAPVGMQVTTGVGMAMITLPRADLEQQYTSFNLERSADGGATWQRRNDEPLMFLSNDVNSDLMMFNDTIEMPNVTYKYRMRGVSPFGFDGPPSNAVDGVGKAPVLGIYPEIKTVTEINGSFDLTWEFPAGNNGDIQKFQVMRSDNAEGGFVVLGEPGVTDRTFNDPSPSPLFNYYKIVAIDNGNSPNQSLAKLGQLNDITPPATPANLEAEVDASGIVTLTWSPNPEADIKGYRVYFSNNPENEFAQITNEVLAVTTFKHQIELKVLGKKVYYKVLATDFRENDSPYSASVFVNRPDVIPPVKPVLTKVEPLPLGVKLEWLYSTSDDVTKHELQRKNKNDQAWSILKTYTTVGLETMYMDSSTNGTGEFSYRMVAFDAAGLGGSSTIIDVKPIRTNIDTIVHFKAVSSVDGTQKQAKLTWEYAQSNPVQEFQIYRSPDGMQPHLYTTYKVNPEEITVDPVTLRAVYIYRDKEINPDETYGYRVLAKFRDGNSSPLTKIVKFQF